MNFDPITPEKANNSSSPIVFVTGATGFLGKRLVEILMQKGYRVRALARKLSNIERLTELGVEIHFGDVGSIDSLRRGFEGIDYVVHAAADTSGRKEESDVSTIQGTRNIVDLCREYNIKKLIYLSSCNVYGVADYKNGEIVTEESSLERSPEKRGVYSEAKLKAEELVTAAMSKGLKAVCLRPGTYFGPGGDIYTSMMGLSFGKLFAIIGNGKKFVLPLIYIDNLVDAIMASMENEKSTGKTYNIVDHDGLNKRQYVDLLLKKIYPGAKFIYIPYSFFYRLVWLQEILIGILGMRPFLTRYRTVSSQRPIIYSSDKIRTELNWIPPYTIKEAIETVIKSHHS